jgi:C4-dicarboxylate-specific signal transduction histidine kinase
LPEGRAVKPPDSDSPNRADGPTTQLLEQLLEVARFSALEEMASGFAHELNQPIGAIATFAQAAERMLAQPQTPVTSVAEVLRHISSEALNAGHAIRRIRSLFNRPTTAREICQIPDVVGELVPALDLLADRHRARLETSFGIDLPNVSIDRLRIQHVLFVLVQNALEAPPRGGVDASVRIDVSSDRYVVLTAVTDRNGGVAKEVRDNVFHPFFTTKSNGTGLGLASSRAIIEAHEGKIGFDDVEDGGTRFWFSLPAASGASLA